MGYLPYLKLVNSHSHISSQGTLGHVKNNLDLLLQKKVDKSRWYLCIMRITPVSHDISELMRWIIRICRLTSGILGLTYQFLANSVRILFR